MLQTVITTLCEQCGPALGEPQAAPAINPHFQFGAHIGGGSLQWQAAGNGGSLTVVPPPGTSSSYTSLPTAVPTSLPLPPIEDRSEAPSLPAPVTSPFPGPVSTGKGYGKASPVVPVQSPDTLPPVSAPLPDEYSNQHGTHQVSPGGFHYGIIDRWISDRGFGFVTADEGGGDVFLHRSAIQSRDYPPRLQARVSFTQTFDSKKDKYKVATISFLPSSQARPNPRHPSRPPYRSSSRQTHATSHGRRPRKSASLSKKRRLTPVRSSPSPTRQISPTHLSFAPYPRFSDHPGRSFRHRRPPYVPHHKPPNTRCSHNDCPSSSRIPATSYPPAGYRGIPRRHQLQILAGRTFIHAAPRHLHRQGMPQKLISLLH